MLGYLFNLSDTAHSRCEVTKPTKRIHTIRSYQKVIAIAKLVEAENSCI